MDDGMAHSDSPTEGRPGVTRLGGKMFDVAVIGGGINGASSAFHLAAAGYNVLLIEKGDFGSGASSRSSRLLHCGLMYLAPYDSYGKMLRHPGHVYHGIQMARYSMRGLKDFREYFSNRLSSFQFYFPVVKGDSFSIPEIRLGFGVLRALNPGGPNLDYDFLNAEQARKISFLNKIAKPESLRGAVRLQENKYFWPERIVCDYILEAERQGATVRNYTAVESIVKRNDGSWELQLRETAPAGDDAAEVSARIVLNFAGVWADKVTRLHRRDATPRVGMTKGTHIAVKLPPEYRSIGFVTMQKGNKGPFFCVPWNDLHYIGPSRTRFEGDIDDVRPSEEDIATLLEDTRVELPGLGLKRSDVLFAWAGVRPQTYDPTHPLKAVHARKLHDLASDGMPNVFALTSSPIMYQKQTGEEVLKLIKGRLRPSREPRSDRQIGSREGEQRLLLDLEAGADGLRQIAVREHCVTLSDVLCRRLGACWNEGLGLDVAARVAELVAPALGWNDARVACEVAAYRDFINRAFVGPFPLQ